MSSRVAEFSEQHEFLHLFGKDKVIFVFLVNKHAELHTLKPKPSWMDFVFRWPVVTSWVAGAKPLCTPLICTAEQLDAKIPVLESRFVWFIKFAGASISVGHFRIRRESIWVCKDLSLIYSEMLLKKHLQLIEWAWKCSLTLAKKMLPDPVGVWYFQILHPENTWTIWDSRLRICNRKGFSSCFLIRYIYILIQVMVS